MAISNSFATKTISLTPLDQEALRGLVDKSADAVVLIRLELPASKSDDKRNFNSALLKFFKGESRAQFAVQSGTIISANGYIVTTSDCIEKATRIVVYRGNGQLDVRKMDRSAYVAKVVKDFPAIGIAVLQITPKDDEKFHFLELGDADDLKNGVVIGKAKGEIFVSPAKPANSDSTYNSFALPIMSGTVVKKDGEKQWSLTPIVGAGGFSEVHGGGLVGPDGKLDGITACSFDQFGLPFLWAIPASEVRLALHSAVPSLLQSPDELRTGIKVHVDPGIKVSDSVLKSVDWPADGLDAATPVSVESVEIGSPAERAGILPRDVLLKFGDDVVTNEQTFENLENHAIGIRSVVLTILRNGKIIEIEVSAI
ncbi:MAG: S1C family serine protease [Holosporales bacterium]|jgi:S1-C subfamily serine protease|nr:S1C family serine protease [Holosporales bacterium]